MSHFSCHDQIIFCQKLFFTVDKSACSLFVKINIPYRGNLISSLVSFFVRSGAIATASSIFSMIVTPFCFSSETHSEWLGVSCFPCRNTFITFSSSLLSTILESLYSSKVTTIAGPRNGVLSCTFPSGFTHRLNTFYFVIAM